MTLNISSQRILIKVLMLLLGVVCALPAQSAMAVPSITAMVPANSATDVPVSSVVQAIFNEAMDPATITTGSFTLSRYVGIKAIVGGQGHTVALKNDGSVVAWGRSDFGQISVPAGLTDVKAIGAGTFNTVALKNNGTVIAWGNNLYGQSSVPMGLSGVTAIATGYYHTVALKSDGTVVAWGMNASGQTDVPAGLTEVIAVAAGYSDSIALKSDGTIIAWGGSDNAQMNLPSELTSAKTIALGANHAAALKNDGSVIAWGNNQSGETNVPAELTGVVAVAVGYSHTLALKNDGTVIAWGDNFYGQSSVPTGLSEVIAIAAGNNHSLALKNDGTIVSWGFNTFGQLNVPVDLLGVTAIAAGTNHSAALKSDGTVASWGYNYFGQTDVPLGLSGVIAVAAGGRHSLTLKNDGTVVAWGNNNFGQTDVPTGLSGATAIAAGFNHSVALKGDGNVVAWGYNSYGETDVPLGLSGVTAIAAGGSNHTVALKGDGNVVAWGYNLYGQTDVPAGLTGVIAIAAGSSHSVALKSDGTVIAWGNNSKGQTSIPIDLTGIIAVAAGWGHTVALKNDGTVVAWGDNSKNQASVPSGLSGVTAIVASENYTMALKSDGTMFGWGFNPGLPVSPYDTQVSGIVTYNPATITATYTPSFPLTPNNIYSARVNAGVRNLRGDHLATDIRQSFSTTVPDTIVPIVAAFSMLTTSSSLTVPVSSLTATDIVSVTGYLLSESSSQPQANDPAWTTTVPTSYTFASQGIKTLYAFAKDAAGNISAPFSTRVTISLPDTTAPTVTAFTIPVTFGSLTVPVSSLVATDNIVVTGYLLQESATIPTVNDSHWTTTPPSSYTFDTVGAKALHAFAKDAAGNISPPASNSVTITLPAIAGVCGSSDGQVFTAIPSNNLCNTGTATTVNGTGPWSWSCNGTNGGTAATCNSSIQTWTITSTVTGGNSTVTCTSPVNSGATSTCTITPESGYQLATFTDNSVDKSGSVAGGYNIPNVTANHTVTATFSLILPTPVNGACGTSNGGPFTIAPTTNYCTTGTATVVTGTGPWDWTCTGSNGGTTSTCNASIQTWTITTSSNVGGNISPQGSVTTTNGSNKEFSVDSTTGYTITDLKIDGVSQALITIYPLTHTGYTFTNVTGNHTISATFNLIPPTPVNGTCGTSNGGTFTIAPTTNFCTTGTATAVTGTGPWGWTCSGTNGGTTATCAANIATSSPTQFTVTPTTGSGYTIAPSTPQTVNNNDTTSFTVTPASGYGIASVSGCVGSVSGTTYTTGPITANCTISVTAVARTAMSGSTVKPTINDALKVLQAVVLITPLNATEKIRYDVAPLSANGMPLGNGVLDAADVILILRRSIDIGSW